VVTQLNKAAASATPAPKASVSPAKAKP